MKCLLLELKDKRKFFTHEKNFDQLIEFCKSFKANLSLVEIKSGKLINLEELVPALCNHKSKQNYEYTIIEKKIKNPISKIKVSTKIKNHIRKHLTSKQTVSIKDVSKKFDKYGISRASLSNYFKEVKLEIEKSGLSVIKIKAGHYKVI